MLGYEVSYLEGGGLNIHDVQDYVQRPVYHPPFLIKNLLAKGGSMLLYGKPGVMKSWLAQNQGFCIATGSEWLGFETTQARVLMVNFEISDWSYHHRLCLMNPHFSLEPQMLYEYSPSILYLDEANNFANFKERVDELEPEVLILDCLSGCFGGDENSSREMAGFIWNMEELKSNGRSIILVHHSNKNLLAVDPMDKARGHSKLVGWVDTVLMLVNQPSGKQLQFGKTRHAPFQLRSMNIVFDEYNWGLRGGQGGQE